MVARELLRRSRPAELFGCWRPLRKARYPEIPLFRGQRSFHISPSCQVVRPYLLADIGEGITECQIIEWMVKPGDRVEQFDPICEVQSDKATVEITSRFDGTIKALHYAVDDMAIVGKPILDIDIDDEEAEGDELLAESAEEARNDQELEHVPEGMEGVLEQARAPPTTSTSTDSPTSTRTSHEGILDGHEDDPIVALNPIETQMFKVMTDALTIPHFLYSHRVDIEPVSSLRKKFNASLAPERSSSKLSLLPFVMKALSDAFVHFPKFNAHLDTTTNASRPQLHVKGAHNFGIAVDTPRGLVVPVVRNVRNQSLTSLAAEIKRLSSLAQDNKLAPEDLKGATFTISNIGSIGGGVVSAVIVPPMLGILAVGRAEDVSVWKVNEQGEDCAVRGESVVLSWSADHRVIDGATVARVAEMVGTLLSDAERFDISSE